MKYNDYKFVLIFTDGDTLRELRISQEQVDILLPKPEDYEFLVTNGWKTLDKSVIELRSFSINEMNKFGSRSGSKHLAA